MTAMIFNEHSSRRRPRVEEVVGHLQQQILLGDLQPGDRLPTEAELCEKFAVSRSTLRESIRMLRAQGVVQVTAGRGSFVMRPGRDQILSQFVTGGRLALNPHEAELHQLLVHLWKFALFSCPLERLADACGTLPMVNVGRSADENLAFEKQWFAAWFNTESLALTGFIHDFLWENLYEWRRQQYLATPFVQQVMTQILRLHVALREGDVERAQRLLQVYFKSAER